MGGWAGCPLFSTDCGSWGVASVGRSFLPRRLFILMGRPFPKAYLSENDSFAADGSSLRPTPETSPIMAPSSLTLSVFPGGFSLLQRQPQDWPRAGADMLPQSLEVQGLPGQAPNLYALLLGSLWPRVSANSHQETRLHSLLALAFQIMLAIQISLLSLKMYFVSDCVCVHNKA